MNILALVISVKCWTASFCIHASKGQIIIMHQLKSIYNSPLKNSLSHPIHTCLATIASNAALPDILSAFLTYFAIYLIIFVLRMKKKTTRGKEARVGRIIYTSTEAYVIHISPEIHLWCNTLLVYNASHLPHMPVIRSSNPESYLW